MKGAGMLLIQIGQNKYRTEKQRNKCTASWQSDCVSMIRNRDPENRKKTLQAQDTPVIQAHYGILSRMFYMACLSLQKRKRASFTIEAALCLPVFLFTALMLLAPMKMLDEKRKLQNVMEAAAKDMAQAAYAERLLKEEGSAFLSGGKEGANAGNGTAGELLEGLGEGLNTGYTAARVLASLNGDIIRGAYFTKCEIIRSDMIAMELSYEMRLPFQIFGIESIPMSSVVNRRAWTGAEGGRGADTYGPGTPEDGENEYDRDEEGDEVVYVGKTSTVYHKDRQCHYLDNVMKRVPGEQVGELRNASGGKYHACEGCKPDLSGSVYIMESGTAYHSSENCKSIGAYAREIKRKDAAHLGPCSYCSGGGKH